MHIAMIIGTIVWFVVVGLLYLFLVLGAVPKSG